MLEKRVDIRPARPTDSAFIYGLAMSPDVRAMSTRSDEFSFQDHERWYAKKLASRRNRIWIMEIDQRPVAQVRYGRPLWGKHAEIAISVLLGERGKGYAKELLLSTEAMARDWLKVNRLVALVLLGNAAGLRLFRSSGYTETGTEKRMGKQHVRFQKFT